MHVGAFRRRHASPLTNQTKARAAQSGPLAEAHASQEVIEQQTALARRRADLAAQRLEAEVRRPADAEAYKQRTLAEAERDHAKFTAEGDAYRRTTLATAEAEAARVRADAAAYAERATAQAEAEANRSRADSLADGNQELIAASRIVEALPSMVTAAAQGIAASNLTILNGTDGVSQVVAGLVGQGLAILDTLKKSAAAAGQPASPGTPAAEVTAAVLAEAPAAGATAAVPAEASTATVHAEAPAIEDAVPVPAQASAAERKPPRTPLRGDGWGANQRP